MVSVDVHGSHAGVQLRPYERFRSSEDQFVMKSYRIHSPEDGYRKAQDIELFCGEANRLGILTPHQCVYVAPIELTTGRADMVSGDVGLYLSQEFAGPTMTQAIADGADPFPLVDLYLQQHAKAFAADNIISLDPPLANFSASGVLIDVFPPRHKIGGPPLIEYDIAQDMPEGHRRFLEDRYFGKKQAVVIFAQIMRALKDVSQSADLPKRVLDAIGRTIGPQYADEVVNALAVNLEHVVPTDVDALRALACVRHAEGDLTGGDLKDIYTMTHITGETGALPVQLEVERARDIVTHVYQFEKQNIYE